MQWHKTKRGVAFQMHTHQRQSSIPRNHPPPAYTREELLDWLMNQEKFHELYDAWVDSGFDRKLKPSVDRLDDYKGYSFDNIQLMTFSENNKKSHEDRINGNNRKQSRAVDQLDMGGNYIQTFHSLHDAARSVGNAKLAAHIKSVCDGKAKYSKGFKWRWTI